MSINIVSIVNGRHLENIHFFLRFEIVYIANIIQEYNSPWNSQHRTLSQPCRHVAPNASRHPDYCNIEIPLIYTTRIVITQTKANESSRLFHQSLRNFMDCPGKKSLCCSNHAMNTISYPL